MQRVRAVLLEYGHKPLLGGANASATVSKGDQEKGGSGGNSSGARAAARALAEEQASAAAAAESASAEAAQMEELASSLAEAGPADAALSGSLAARIVAMRSGEIRDAAEKFKEGAGEEAMGGAIGRAATLERQLAAGQAQVEQAEKARAGVSARAAEAAAALESAKERLREAEAHNERCVAETRKLEETVGSPENAAAVERLMSLVKKTQDQKQAESSFKAECKKKLAALHGEIAQEKGALLSPEEEARIAEVKATFEGDQAKWDLLRQALGKHSRAVALINRKLEEIPTRPELLQYERRFVELYEQVQAKLDETRRCFAHYNVMTDTLSIMGKEVSLLNSILSQFQKARGDRDTIAALSSSLEAAFGGVQQTRKRTAQKLEAELKASQSVRDAYNAAFDRQRAYAAAVKEFQAQCARQERLLAEVERLKADKKKAKAALRAEQ
mmetsp:Transcript_24841/g.81269  ORF Transcript_24841/g.81269 Transcript_24841/m.81269 type:complete len:445 (-) Transcript_24841:105-1439(-)